MDVGKNWMIKFLFEVPRPIKNRLINLGLPVAGLKFKVDGDGVVFDGVLRVTPDGKYYWKTRELSTREFVNMASMLREWEPYAVEKFAGIFDLSSVRIVHGDTLVLGRYRIKEFLNARLVDFFYVWGDRLDFPGTGSIPKNVVVHRENDYTAIAIKRGKCSIIVSGYDDDGYYESWVAYRGLGGDSIDDAHDLADAFDDNEGLEVIASVAEKHLEKFSSRPAGDGREILYGDKPIAYDNRNVLIVSSDWNGIIKHVNDNYLNEGWTFIYNRGNFYYRKKFGNIEVRRNGSSVWVVFRNGNWLFDSAENFPLELDLNGYFRILPML